MPSRVGSEAECLEQILEAFHIADRDDIHQAAARLTRVQDSIRRRQNWPRPTRSSPG